ncbi:MAG: CRISPR-associated helicase Cas3' [Ignavibacteriae bacterium]|nr:MAG: CRISPR-associated helicase Cas3' [Ignavibacteriota bacterium]
MKTFNELIGKYDLCLKHLLSDEGKYYAHSKNDYLEYESLSIHTDLVLNYFQRLITKNNLEAIIDNIINVFVKENASLDKVLTAEYIKYLFIKSIYYHDFGKVNENFQIVKLKNAGFKKVDNGIESQHSILSSYLFLASSFDEIQKTNISDHDKFFLSYLSFLFAYIISKHHGHIENGKDLIFEDIKSERLIEYLNTLNNLKTIDKASFLNFLQNNNRIVNYFSNLNACFELFLLLKLNASLLTASDYYATSEFMIGLRCEDFGVMNEELKKKIIHKTYEISYNKTLNENFNYYENLKVSELKGYSNEILNHLRQKLSAEAIINIRSNKNKRLFYIEAPTGSGKTNLSLLALTEILKHKDISKVFYIFPFTTLITQTYSFLKGNLQLTDSEITEIHSKAPFIQKDNNENELDVKFDSERKNFIDNLFVNFPISLVSHIKFFDILTSNEKETNYLLHRLANSVVIIDEIQSYNPTEWDKVNYLIQRYSKAMNITFIIMSATLPKISSLLIDTSEMPNDNFVYLIKNKQDYFSNPNFKDRVKFRFDYLNSGEFSFEKLAGIVFKHSEDYCKKNGCVKTIVEFVTKKSAQGFLSDEAFRNIFKDYEIIPITGTILEPRRRAVIDYLKSANSIKNKILIVCTQVIEAGLDIDMDIGFKDKAIVDSEEQLAGRINRNATKTDSELFIFYSHDSSKTYKTDLRYKQKIDNELYQNILTEKDFDSFYKKVFEKINRDNNDPYLANNLSDFITQIREISFKNVKNKFQLINDNTISVFVPCEIEEKYFTENEINFLKIFQNNICMNNLVNGEFVWDIYNNIITNKTIGFIDKKIDLKIISPIISKFCFNVWNNQKLIDPLLHRGEERYGFIKLSLNSYKEIYSFETGLKSNLETDCNFI